MSGMHRQVKAADGPTKKSPAKKPQGNAGTKNPKGKFKKGKKSATK